MMFLKTLWNNYTTGKKVLRISKEPELEFFFQYFQNDISRIEFIRQKSLVVFKDLEISNPTDYAVKIFPFGDEKIIKKIQSWKHYNKSSKLKDSENSDIYYCIYMNGDVNQIKNVAHDIMLNIFDLKDNDEIEYGVKIYE